MNTNIGHKIDVCGRIIPVSDGSSVPAENGKIYEIIRVIDGRPLFFDDHMDRMEMSAATAGVTLSPDRKNIRGRIVSLCGINGYSACNVKVVGPMDDGGVMIYVSAFSYPDESLYDTGVDTDFIRIERPNPNAKIMRDSYKETVTDFINSHGCYEALLVSDDGTVTEGSRSNVFFVSGDRVFTTPGDLVLRGITRGHILDACKRAGAEVSERILSVGDIAGLDGLFISGTSIGVLPVRRAGEYTFGTADLPLVRSIRQQYEQIVKENLL